MSEVYNDIVATIKEKFERTKEIDHHSLLTAGYLNDNFVDINGERSIMVKSALHVFDCTATSYKARLFADIRNGSEMITNDVVIEASAIKARMSDDQIKDVCYQEVVTPWSTVIDYEHIFKKNTTGHFPKKGTAGSDIEVLYPFTIAEEYKLDLREATFQLVMSYKKGGLSEKLSGSLDRFFSREYNEKHLLFRNLIDGSSFKGNNSAYKLPRSEKKFEISARASVGTSGKPAIQLPGNPLMEFDEIKSEEGNNKTINKEENSAASSSIHVRMPTSEKMAINNAISTYCTPGLTFRSIIILAAFGTVGVVIFAIFAVMPIMMTAMSFFFILIIYAMLGLVFLIVIYMLFDKDQLMDLSMSTVKAMSGAISGVRSVVSPPSNNMFASTNQNLNELNRNAEGAGQVASGLWEFGKTFLMGFSKAKKK